MCNLSHAVNMYREERPLSKIEKIEKECLNMPIFNATTKEHKTKILLSMCQENNLNYRAFEYLEKRIISKN